MEWIENFGDGRIGASCIYCGGPVKDSKDHVPSNVFLDEPYPEHRPYVHSCSSCNQGFSLDEQYLACFLECVVCGTTDPQRLEREKIRRTLEKRPALRSRVEEAKREARNPSGGKLLIWQPEEERVRHVILKLAKGHAFYELNEVMDHEPDHISFIPMHVISEEARVEFEASALGDIELAPWPEVDSRAMQRLVTGADLVDGWVSVQEQRYRYQAATAGFVAVRMVIREYLAAEVVWKS